MSEALTKEQIAHFDQSAKWVKTDDHEDPCHIWQGLVTGTGSPVYRPRGKNPTSAYRYGYLASGKTLEPGQRVQQCPRHRYCVRGSHLTVKIGRRAVL